MRRALLCVILVVSLTVPFLLREARAQSEPVTAGPFQFLVTGALVGAEFDEPLDWGPNEDGRLFLLVSLLAVNTTTEEHNLNSNEFRIVDGGDFIPADDNLSKRPEGLGLPAMGDVIGDDLGGGDAKVYILAWRLEPRIDSYTLDITYGDGARINLDPYVGMGISAEQLVPTATTAPTATLAPTSTPAPPTPTIDPRAASVVGPDTRVGFAAGTGFGWLDLDDADDELSIVAMGGGQDGTWAGVVYNGADDPIFGLSIDAEVDGSPLGTADTLIPTLLNEGHVGLVFSPNAMAGASVGGTPESGATPGTGTPGTAGTPGSSGTPGSGVIDGLVTGTITDTVEIDEVGDEAFEQAPMRVVSAAVLADEDVVHVSMTGPTETGATNIRVGLVCFDYDGFISGGLVTGIGDQFRDLGPSAEITTTVPLDGLECDTVIAGAAADRYDAPVPTATIAPTSTTAPPTATAAPPTSTPQTMVTREATSVPRATATSDADRITTQERTYLDELAEQQETLYRSIVNFSELAGEAADDISLIRTDEWVISMAAQLVVWELTYTEAQELRPSARQQEIHDLWLSMTADMAGAVDDMTAFVDNLDTAAGQRVTIAVGGVDAQIPVLQGLIEDFEDDPSSFGSSSGGSASAADRIPSPVADCSPFATYEIAQEYYADHPEEQPVIDPDADGYACEVYFGVDPTTQQGLTQARSLVGTGATTDFDRTRR